MKVDNRRCPICNSEMRIKHDAEITVDRCPRQHGTWFDPAEFRQFVRQKEGRKFSESRARRQVVYAEDPARECPGCGEESLRPGQLDGLTIHACECCGGFFVPIATSNRVRDLTGPVVRKYKDSSWSSVLNFLFEVWP